MKLSKNRIIWIDNLRGISCVLIVLLHVIAGWIDPNGIVLTQYSIRWFIDCFLIQILVRPALPIFIMITGALLLDNNKEFTYEKQVKYIVRMLVVLLVFGFTYCLLEEFITNGVGNIIHSVLVSFIHLLENKSWGAMWYIYMLVGLYIITPILKSFVNNCNKKIYTFILVCLFIITTVVPTINYIFKIEITDFYLKDFIYIFYYLLGYYIYKVLPTIEIKRKHIIMYVIGVIGYIGFALLLILKNFYYNPTGNNRIMFVAMISMFIFWMFSNKKIKEKSNAFISLLSKYSFGIYLTHIFWLNVLYKGIHIFPTFTLPGIGEALVLLYATLLSLVSSFVLYKLPLFKKILK